MLEDRPLDLPENHIALAVRVGELRDRSLIGVRIGHIRNVVCASPKYLKRRGTPKVSQDLANHDCINFTFAALMSPDVWTFRAGKSEISMRIRSRLIVNTAEAAIDAAIADVGITRVLSHQVKKVAQSGALTMVLTKFESAPMPSNFIYTGRNVVVRLRLKGDGDVAVVTCERGQSIATTGDADFVDYPRIFAHQISYCGTSKAIWRQTADGETCIDSAARRIEPKRTVSR